MQTNRSRDAIEVETKGVRSQSEVSCSWRSIYPSCPNHKEGNQPLSITTFNFGYLDGNVQEMTTNTYTSQLTSQQKQQALL